MREEAKQGKRPKRSNPSNFVENLYDEEEMKMFNPDSDPENDVAGETAGGADDVIEKSLNKRQKKEADKVA